MRIMSAAKATSASVPLLPRNMLQAAPVFCKCTSLKNPATTSFSPPYSMLFITMIFVIWSKATMSKARTAMRQFGFSLAIGAGQRSAIDDASVGEQVVQSTSVIANSDEQVADLEGHFADHR